MFGLPSTFAVNQKIPKNAFYRNLDVTSKQRDLFTKTIDSITVIDDITARTFNGEDGHDVHEIMVIGVLPKEAMVPDTVYLTIDKANTAKKIFVNDWDGSCSLVVNHGILRAPTVPATLTVRGTNLDSVWQSLMAQLLYGVLDGTDIQEQLARSQALDSLSDKRSALERALGRERQFRKKNQLFEEIRAVKHQLNILKEQSSVWLQERGNGDDHE